MSPGYVYAGWELLLPNLLVRLSISSFNYDKLNALEIQALAVLEAFQVVKVKDFLHVADDPEMFSKFLGNAYIFSLFLFDNLIIL